MDADVEPADPAEANWVARQRRWTQGWRRFALPGVFLVYLLYVAQAVSKHSHGAGAVAGYTLLVVFCACYLLTLSQGPPVTRRRFWVLYGVLFALFVAELPFARDVAFLMCVYITAVTVARLGARSVPVVLVLALAALLVPVAIPSWHESLGTSFGNVIPVAIPVVALVTFGVLQVLEGNRALAQARAELARLAAENERFRIARDLHDLLGHSLTTITVKAGLARQLGEADPARALQEIAEVEALARGSLADVRAAVSNYRDVTLAGELATGRELLRAAGIAADLPAPSTSSTPPTRSCSGGSCAKGSPTSFAMRTPAGAQSGCRRAGLRSWTTAWAARRRPGSGLSGLRERVAAAGGVVDAGPLQPNGWRLRVSLIPEAGA